MTRQKLDLDKRADNGLRRGYTTGTCATAAVKAAASLLLHERLLTRVEVTLADPEWYVDVPVERVERQGGKVFAGVRKYAGDDPDNTDGALITAWVEKNDSGAIRFHAGEGVGIVTAPGLRVPVGEPAINPVPRRMMCRAIDEVLGATANPGFDLTIGCVNGEQIAKKTFNPRLGIKGGISILGTSGIVEPMSLAAWIASIEVYIRVALGTHPDAIAYAPGKIGLSYARQVLGLPSPQVVQIANFMGDALAFTQQVLEENDRRLGRLWVLGHPGKIAKILNGDWDTHSRKSDMAMTMVAQIAHSMRWDSGLVHTMEQANTVEAIVSLLHQQPHGKGLWMEVEKQTASLIQARVPRVDTVKVGLFAMDGTPLGELA
jgi:cobalt-precorrin-5B (C1)-methyltransferase